MSPSVSLNGVPVERTGDGRVGAPAVIGEHEPVEPTEQHTPGWQLVVEVDEAGGLFADAEPAPLFLENDAPRRPSTDDAAIFHERHLAGLRLEVGVGRGRGRQQEGDEVHGTRVGTAEHAAS